MEKQDGQHRIQMFALWSLSGAAGACEKASSGWNQNLTINSNSRVMRSLPYSVVCSLVVSSIPRLVRPVKLMAKLLLSSTLAGLPITFLKHSSSYRGLSAVSVQSPKHLFYLQFPFPANTPKQDNSYCQSQWEPLAQQECAHACKKASTAFQTNLKYCKSCLY